MSKNIVTVVIHKPASPATTTYYFYFRVLTSYILLQVLQNDTSSGTVVKKTSFSVVLSRKCTPKPTFKYPKSHQRTRLGQRHNSLSGMEHAGLSISTDVTVNPLLSVSD
jgi:hypothetical protein